ncbi:MAG: lamin tail domain-containing protein, partial [Candidatus Omnitrophica bacterium]|nr:lamin tail domain-containing protein [Candidatus Omnitrophota bacterium]
MARWAAWFLPLTLNATVINIDFNGDRYDPGPNARPITYVGQSPAGGGPVWNGLAVDSRLSDGTDDDNITVTGTNLLDSLGGVTAVSFTASPVGGDSTALRMGQSTDDPTQASALFSDYLFNNSSANHAGESPFAITGLGNARTVDLYFYLTSGGITIAGQSPTSFAGSGIFNGGNTYYFQNVPVNAGSVAGTFGSGTAVIGGMTVAGDFVVVPEPINILLQPTHQTVLEGTSVVFQVQVANAGAVSYQWQRNGTDIPRAIAASYNIPWVSGANQGDRFRCLITNEVSSVASAEAVLTVIPDTTPPVIREVQNVGNSQLQIIFSEPLDGSSATNPSQYQLGNGAVVSAAALDNDQQTVILTTSPLAFGTNYTLTVNDVRDRAWIPNSIAADTKYSFTLSDYLTHTVGGADLQGAIIPDTAGFNLSVRGGEIGGTADQFLFGCQQRSGDFDLEVRVASIGLSDPWAKAGLMVRDSLDANSRFAVILATPSVAGCLFMSRVTTGAAAVPAGSFPVNYPYTWLRLQRVGTQFNGYGSWDGSHWTRLGSVTITMPSSVYFGMVSVSHSSTQSTTAQLEDLQNAVDGTVGSSVLPREPLDACSRRTGLVISEIMYHPAKRADGKDLEYIELFNSQSFFQDLSGYRLSGDIDYIFPPGTQLAAGAFLVVAKNPADMRAAYSLSNVMGPYSSRLPHRSGVVRLCNAIGAVLLEVRYDSHHPWPASADGAGHSIVLARPSYGEGNPAAWAASDRIGGSPGV